MSTSAELVSAGKIVSGLGHVVYHFPVLDSTNAFAAKLLQKSTPPHGAQVSAGYQTAGKGQMGSGWYSSPGKNLLVSYILYPEMEARQQFLVSMAVALAVSDVVSWQLAVGSWQSTALNPQSSVRSPQSTVFNPQSSVHSHHLRQKRQSVQDSESEIRNPDLCERSEWKGQKSEIRNPKSEIKWPNDIYLNDRKVAGILIQNTLQGEKIKACVVGIGLNVNETEFPAALPNPTSLALETLKHLKNPQLRHSEYLSDLQAFQGQRPQDLQAFPFNLSFDLHIITQQLSYFLQQRLILIIENPEALREEYHALLYRRGVPSMFRVVSKGRERKGMISHVDESGRLVVKWGDGDEGVYGMKELVYV